MDRTQVIPTYKGPLQERSLDIGRALKNVNLMQSSLDCRANVEQSNHQCFERSAKICELLDIEVKKPRICGRQIMRDNVEAESPEDYFRKSITVPFLYCTLNEMKTRFTDLHARTALGLQLVPSIIENIAPYLSPPPPSTESLDPPLIPHTLLKSRNNELFHRCF